MTAETILLLSLCCVIAYFVKGVAGFGPALVMVPWLAVLFDPHIALSTSAFLDFLVGCLMIVTLKYRWVDLKIVGPMAIALVLGTVVGAVLAGYVPQRIVLILMACVVAIFGVVMIFFHEPAPTDIVARGSKLVVGGCLLGGLSSGLVGISGPFIVMALRPKAGKGDFRRLLVALFLIGGVFRLVTYGTVGVWTNQVLVISLWASPAVVIGLFIGYRQHDRISERSFSIIVGIIMLVLSGRIAMSLLS